MQNIPEALQQADAFHRAGDVAQAERCYREILAAEPAQFDAIHSLGVIEAQRGRFEEALRLVGQALKIEPQSIAANVTYGNVLKALNRHAQALAICNKVLALDPDSALAHYNRGNVLLDLNRYSEALADYDRVLALMPDNAPALYNRGCVLQQLKRHEEAFASFDRVLTLMPDNVAALHNRGAALHQLNRYEDALASYDRVLTLEPGDVEALANRGVALYELKRYEEALTSYERALAIAPGFAEAWSNRANVLLDLKRPVEALASWDRALAIKPDFVDALNNRSHALLELERHADAAASYAQVLAIAPDYEYAPGMLVHSKMHCCDWRMHEQESAHLVDDVRGGKRSVTPFAFLGVSHSAADQLQCARTWVNDKCPASDIAVWNGARYRHDRIRLAYLSADLRDHPVSYLLAGLFERHERSRFETTAISFGVAATGEMHERLKGSFERFVDVRDKSDFEIAQLLKELEIDIAVDLMGFTTQSRTRIFAHRPAPIQVNFLGYPGTMGADYIDYIIGDRMVIPEDQRANYAEQVAYLPDTFQPNDSRKRIAEHTPTRAEAGLPEQGFVFCSFNNSYKITPAVFEVWMSLLKTIDASVLWLQQGNEAAVKNLRQAATDKGVAAERIIFAPRTKLLEDHLARYRLADLFLDTLPYNAHATASDALWAGVPVLTCLETTYAGRVAASLLNAIGLPELVTHSLENYEALALKLATDAELLAGIKAKLAQNRNTYPLFDTDRFRRHIEAAYVTMWERQQRGEPPASFAVPALSL